MLCFFFPLPLPILFFISFIVLHFHGLLFTFFFFFFPVFHVLFRPCFCGFVLKAIFSLCLLFCFSTHFLFVFFYHYEDSGLSFKLCFYTLCYWLISLILIIICILFLFAQTAWDKINFIQFFTYFTAMCLPLFARNAIWADFLLSDVFRDPQLTTLPRRLSFYPMKQDLNRITNYR